MLQHNPVDEQSTDVLLATMELEEWNEWRMGIKEEMDEEIRDKQTDKER